jgi:hypothetical protein
MSNNYREISYEMLVRKADPDYNRQLHHELEYVFGEGRGDARRFYIDPFNSGPYGPYLRASDTDDIILTDGNSDPNSGVILDL